MDAFCAQILPSSIPNRTVQAAPPADHNIGRTLFVWTGAESGSRTRTRLPSSVFETDASAIPPPRRGPNRPFGGGSTISFAGATTHRDCPVQVHARRLCTLRPSWNPGRQYDLDPVGDLVRLSAPLLSAARQPPH